MVRRETRRRSVLLASLALLLLGVTAHAHPGHDDALTKVQAIAIAKAAIRRMIENGEAVQGELLAESWIDAEGRASCEATPVYYLVGLQNYAEGQKLFVLLDHTGQFRRARFKPDFAELRFSSFPVFPCERW